jgi:hypothetical protein
MHAQKVIAFRRSKLVDLQIIYAGKVLREESLLVKDFLRPVSIRFPMQILCKSTDLALLLCSCTLLAAEDRRISASLIASGHQD